MARSHSDILRHLRLAVPGLALAVGLAACDATPVTSGTVGGGTSAAQATGTGTATLNWTAVTTNTNGTPLTDLAGYTVYYGSAANELSTVVVLADPGATSYVVTSLSPGTWYFAVNAYTNSGLQGVLSNIASKTIN
jgi:Fibronectin type III domain